MNTVMNTIMNTIMNTTMNITLNTTINTITNNKIMAVSSADDSTHGATAPTAAAHEPSSRHELISRFPVR
jgi:hypothetical protein